MRLNLLVLPFLLTAGLAAQETRFGIQGAVSIPSGDLADGAALGLQVGGHLRWDFGRGHGLMARADYTSFGGHNDVNTSSLGVAADYMYHFDRSNRGFYVLAGLSMTDYHREFPDGTLNDNAFGVDLGIGLDLDRHLGLQARVTSQSVSGASLTALNLGVTYTF